MNDLLAEMPVDAALGDLRAVLAPSRVLRACKAALSRATASERASWQAARVIEALYSPGREIRIAYALLSDPQTPEERIWPEAQIVYLVSPVRESASQRGELLEIDGLRFEAYHFPNDRRLRSVRHFQGKNEAVGAWQQWIDAGAADFQIEPESLRRRFVRYVPEQKWIIRLRADGVDPRDGRASKRRIAVLAANARQCESVAARHRALAKWAREHNATFSIPDVVGQSPDLDLVALEWLRGDSLLDALHRDARVILRRIARVMHEFHQIPAELIADCEAANSLDEMNAAVTDLTCAMPERAERLMGLMREFQEACRFASAGKPVLLHNDFHWNQVTIKPNRLVLLDLDCLARGDALIDVANFSTQLALLGARPELEVSAEQARRWSRVFLDCWHEIAGGMQAADGPNSHERHAGAPDTCGRDAHTPRRMAVYSAAAAMRLARGMMRHLRPGWRELAVTCIAQAEAALCLREPV